MTVLIHVFLICAWLLVGGFFFVRFWTRIFDFRDSFHLWFPSRGIRLPYTDNGFGARTTGSDVIKAYGRGKSMTEQNDWASFRKGDIVTRMGDDRHLITDRRGCDMIDVICTSPDAGGIYKIGDTESNTPWRYEKVQP